MVAASEVIALRTRFATLAFGGACQLLQFAVKFFDLPAQLVRRDLLQWSHDLSAMDTRPRRRLAALRLACFNGAMTFQPWIPVHVAWHFNGAMTFQPWIRAVCPQTRITSYQLADSLLYDSLASMEP